MRVPFSTGTLSMSIAPPYGGILKELLVPVEKMPALKDHATSLRSWDLNERQTCDVEMLLCGAFSPLEGFLGKADYEGVVNNMRLADGTLWPIPVTLDVSEDFARGLEAGSEIALRDAEGVLIAVMELSDAWQPDLQHEALQVLGSNDSYHPAVDHLKNRTAPVYLGGKLRGLQMPMHYDCKHLRHTPAQLADGAIFIQRDHVMADMLSRLGAK